MASAFDRRTIATLGTIFVTSFLLWDTLLVYPLKVLVVLLHEISHGIAAVLTGGSIVRIEVNADEGGVCYTSGGIRFFTLTAGYLGSMFSGAVLLVIASRSRHDRKICTALGIFLAAVSLFYVENRFGYWFGLLFGTGLVVAARALPYEFSDLTLKTIGLTSCLYAILDIKSDVLDRRGIGSDADMLADLTSIPAIIWGILWILLALVVAAFALLLAGRGEER